MEITQQIQELAHQCGRMHMQLRNGRPVADVEFQLMLLERHLRKLAAELALKRSRQVPDAYA